MKCMNSYKQQINMHNICSKTFTKQGNNKQMKCICTTKEKKYVIQFILH